MQKKNRMLRWMIVPLAFLMVGAIAIVGYAAWVGGTLYVTDGTGGTGSVATLHLNATAGITQTNSPMRLVPVTQPNGTFNTGTHARVLAYNVQVQSAEAAHDLFIAVHGIDDALATGSQLRVLTTDPTALATAPQTNAAVGGTAILGGGVNIGTQVRMNPTALAPVTGAAETFNFWIVLISDNADDMNNNFQFTVTIALAGETPSNLVVTP